MMEPAASATIWTVYSLFTQSVELAVHTSTSGTAMRYDLQ
jgi:hypothetical protein